MYSKLYNIIMADHPGIATNVTHEIKGFTPKPAIFCEKVGARQDAWALGRLRRGAGEGRDLSIYAICLRAGNRQASMQAEGLVYRCGDGGGDGWRAENVARTACYIVKSGIRANVT